MKSGQSYFPSFSILLYLPCLLKVAELVASEFFEQDYYCGDYETELIVQDMSDGTVVQDPDFVTYNSDSKRVIVTTVE